MVLPQPPSPLPQQSPAPPPQASRGTAASVIPRVVLFFLVGYLSLTVLAQLLYPAFGLLIASIVGVFAGAALANSLAIRIFERLRLPDIGLHWNRRAATSLALGVAGGICAGMAAVLLPAAIGLAGWQPATESTSTLGGFLFMTAMLLFGAAGEEMLFRGYGLQVLAPVLGPMATILPSSVVFAATHADNPSVSWLGLFNTFLWGVALACALLRTGSLWTPIGLHFGWNWVLPILGVNVSGFTMRLTGHSLVWRVGPVWSGGEYGPEGGLFCTIAVSLIGFLIFRLPLPQQELALLRRPDERKTASEEEEVVA